MVHTYWLSTNSRGEESELWFFVLLSRYGAVSQWCSYKNDNVLNGYWLWGAGPYHLLICQVCQAPSLHAPHHSLCTDLIDSASTCPPKNLLSCNPHHRHHYHPFPYKRLLPKPFSPLLIINPPACSQLVAHVRRNILFIIRYSIFLVSHFRLSPVFYYLLRVFSKVGERDMCV